MKRDWDKYLNSQFYSECQLISALNAYYRLTGKQYTPQKGVELRMKGLKTTVINSDYEELVDVVKARHGAAITIGDAHKLMGLKTKWKGKSLYDFNHTEKKNPKWKRGSNTIARFIVTGSKNKLPLPIEVKVWHPRYGFHSVLIVDHEPKTDAYQVTNFGYATTIQGWIFKEDFDRYVNDGNTEWSYRVFELKKKK